MGEETTRSIQISERLMYHMFLGFLFSVVLSGTFLRYGEATELQE